MSEAVIDLSLRIEEKIKLNKNIVLKKIFDDYYDRIYKFFIYRTNNKHTAEELTSIVFEKLVINIDSYDSRKSPFSSWIFTIARNSMYDYFKMDKSKDTSPIEEYENTLKSEDNIEEEIDKEEKKKSILQLLEGLDERERSIISYKFGGGLQNNEIAMIMDLSPSNVGSILHRSMKKLKKLLEEAE